MVDANYHIPQKSSVVITIVKILNKFAKDVPKRLFYGKSLN